MENRRDHGWRKSSYSGNGGANCVGVGTGPAGTVAVRDSKDPQGPVLIVSPGDWARFLTRLRATA